ncbi:MAG: bifunctional metallophosphatase/5'-nucleotidase [Propionibacteriaceae bacterium]|jgi:5'-nucleotidase|nr:bifunctional metallophosphatase/5'-nucleotidase [Propionibacteriaceae bacterium]
MFRRATAVVTATLTLCAAGLAGFAAAPAAQADDTRTIHVLTFNDFHGRINANTVAWAATLEEEALKDPANTIVVSGGDNVGASEFASFIQNDNPTIQLLNDLKASGIRFEASVVGNHEFDQGYADLKNRIIGGKNADGTDAGIKAAWTYLGANVVSKTDGQPVLDPYYIYTLPDGLKIAVIGAVTQETPTLVSPAGVADLNFLDPVDTVNKYADQIKADKLADIVIADYHEGAATAESLDAALKATAVFKKIVNETSNSVDAIITAHTHLAYGWNGLNGEDAESLDTHQGRPVVQTGSYGANVGVIDLTWDATAKKVTAGTAKNVATMATPEAGSDAEKAMLAIGNITTIKQHVDAALAKATELGSVTVGQIGADITTAYTGGAWTDGKYTATDAAVRDDRANESTLATLVADAFLETADSSDVINGADIGIINAGGGLRAELVKGADGKLTYSSANAVLPFVNNLWTITLTGAQFKNFLEEQWQAATDGSRPARPFLATGVSSNVTYTVDTDQPTATPCTLEQNCSWNDTKSHITQVFIDGQPLQEAKEYKIITISFLTAGGDNYRIMTQGKNATDTGLVDRDAWIAALEKFSGMTAAGATATKTIAPNYARASVVVTNLTPATAPMAAVQVTAGEKVTATFSRLNLTSLGSPANTTMTTYLAAAGATTTTTYGTELATVNVTAPSDKAGCTAAGVSADLNALSTGCAKLDVTIPAGTAVGDYILTSVVSPSNTLVRLAVHVNAPAASPSPSPSAGASASASAAPSASASAVPSASASASALPGTGAQTGRGTVGAAWIATLIGIAMILIAVQRRRADLPEARHGV